MEFNVLISISNCGKVSWFVWKYKIENSRTPTEIDATSRKHLEILFFKFTSIKTFRCGRIQAQKYRENCETHMINYICW